jgi:hypothetical protein
MGDVVGLNGGKIVNPMAATVLTLTVTDQNQVNLQSALPPNMVIKILQGIVTDIIMNALAEAMQPKSPIV